LADLQRTIYPYNWSLVRCRSSTGQAEDRDVLPLCHATNQRA